jgi:hypothetical protein
VPPVQSRQGQSRSYRLALLRAVGVTANPGRGDTDVPCVPSTDATAGRTTWAFLGLFVVSGLPGHQAV